ncbi:HisA/HisF-related TIM barrel protein [Gammaproteobacteria bacterium]|nr:HisA/HisF-related TIM barrel protein [Gammaproteobacteria bacterium]
MLRSRIIPSLLMDDGELVKTSRFKDEIYIGDPMNAVRIFNEKSVDELAIFDISATAGNKPIDMELLKDIAKVARMPLCYGGGINSVEQAVELVKSGFEKISISSAALTNPEILSEIGIAIGSQSVVLCLDVLKEKTLSSEYSIYTHRGKIKTDLDLRDALKITETHKVGEIIINSIDEDGMMNGYDLSLARLVKDQTKCPITFLGGAGDTQDIINLINEVGLVGAAAGSMFVFKGINKAVLLSYNKPI